MTTPTILDAAGNRLEVGSRAHDCVRFYGYPDYWATVTEIKWNYGWEVWLRGPDDPRAGEAFEAHIVADVAPNTYRCPDLTLIPTTDEETR